VDGHLFPSKREADRYRVLDVWQTTGEISDLRLQVRFPLVAHGADIGTYVADFAYRTSAGALVVEDAKGVRTEAYRLKKKLFEAQYRIVIQEV
jgi:hypothetical protein